MNQYVDTLFLVPTSNICERFFSKCGHALGSKRMATLPINAEAQMFLHMNMGLWGIDTVKAMLSDTR